MLHQFERPAEPVHQLAALVAVEQGPVGLGQA